MVVGARLVKLNFHLEFLAGFHIGIPMDTVRCVFTDCNTVPVQASSSFAAAASTAERHSKAWPLNTHTNLQSN